jgi:hypothetical protein
MTFELLNRDGTTIKMLDEINEQGWTDPVTGGAGQGTFAVPNTHPDINAFQPFRVIRGYLNGTARFLWQIVDRPYTRLDPDGNAQHQTVITGPGGLSLLGGYGGPDRAVVIDPDGQSGYLTFGWVAKVYDATAWDSPAPYSGGHYDAPRMPSEPSPPDFIDPQAEWLWSSNTEPPTGRAWIRHVLDEHDAREDVVMFITGRYVTAFFNGDQIIEHERSDQVSRINLDVTGDDLLAITFDRRVMYTIGYFEGEGEDEIFTVLYRSTTGAPYNAGQNEIQQVVIDPDDQPFPWGTSYPSPGGLTGTARLTFRGQTTAGVSYDINAATFDSSDWETALEALSNIDGVTTDGDATSDVPLTVEFDGAAVANKPHPLMTIIHSDLRHDHATTKVTRLQAGKVVPVAASGFTKISFTNSEPLDVTFGYVVGRIVAAAVLRGVLTEIDTSTIDDDEDHNGVPWTVRLPMYRIRDGDQVGKVVEQGFQDFGGALARMAPSFQLRLYDDMDSLGTDRTGSVEFTDSDPIPANNVVISAYVQPFPPQATHGRVEFDGGFGWVSDAALAATYGRRETSVSLGTAFSENEALTRAEGFLDDLGPHDEQTITTWDHPGARPYVNYEPGDLVNVRLIEGGSYVAFRVMSIQALHAENSDNEELFDVTLRREG